MLSKHMRGWASAGFAILAVSTSVVAGFFVLSAPVSNATGNALAYGDEQRFLLRIPTPLLLGPVPLAVAEGDEVGDGHPVASLACERDAGAEKHGGHGQRD